MPGTGHRDVTVRSAAVAVEFSRQKVTVMPQRQLSLGMNMRFLGESLGKSFYFVPGHELHSPVFYDPPSYLCQLECSYTAAVNVIHTAKKYVEHI